MKYYDLKDKVILGGRITVEDLIAVARYGAKVEFDENYKARVRKARELVERWTDEEKVMYGITTGFGSLVSQTISREDAAKLQHNIISCHAVSVGRPYSEEEARAVMLMILLNTGLGFSGVRLEVLEVYKEMLNRGVTPWAPRDGSVGYLNTEGHFARVVEGSGQAYYQGELLDGAEAMKRAGIPTMPLASKEGLALISGSSSPTALAALSIYDLNKASLNADLIAALSFEAARCQLNCIDPRVMSVKRHTEQAKVADNMRRILADSAFLKKYQGDHLQDALSLRAVPQLHGAARKTLEDALVAVENEMNSCADNPVVWPGSEAAGVDRTTGAAGINGAAGSDPEAWARAEVLSACNCDSAYVGIEMDSAAIAATNLAKMSERRNTHLIDSRSSGYPSFMVAKPGLNSGLMIPQYAQAGLLGEMRILSTSSTIDNTPTCAGQEDYVAMGYNACKKAIDVAEKLEYILAMELLTSYESTHFTAEEPQRGSVSREIFKLIGREVPLIEEDIYLGDGIEYIRQLIHDGSLLKLAQSAIPQFE